VAALAVREGDSVDAGQEIASIRGPGGTETLSAPWAGTVMNILVHRGDTVTPGAPVANLGDLSRLRVETTDVDEYLVAQVHRGQPVTVRVDALNGRILQGYVRSVASDPQPGAQGTTTLQYPVVIDLVENPPDLRPGMTVRLSFESPQPVQASPTATRSP
jgi:multidrug efflux pump subunit AcrA (membrane-fusion protein)